MDVICPNLKIEFLTSPSSSLSSSPPSLPLCAVYLENFVLKTKKYFFRGRFEAEIAVEECFVVNLRDPIPGFDKILVPREVIN